MVDFSIQVNEISKRYRNFQVQHIHQIEARGNIRSGSFQSE